MQTNTDLTKQIIRRFFKSTNIVSTKLGELALDHKSVREGGNSLVYNATWGGKQQVVVKFLAEVISGKKPSKRYLRIIDELRAIMPLTETGLVATVYHFDLVEIESQKYPYVVMRRYPYTLVDWSKSNPVRSLKSLEPLLEGLMDCLNVIHKNGIVHRDLKPENIFLNEENKIILGDFGIAWFDPQQHSKLAKTSKSERLANYLFSAPEQVTGPNKSSPTMDLYALGQIIQWLVTGKTHRGTGRQKLQEYDKSLASIDDIIDLLLQNDPKKRPQSIEELRAKLKEGSEGYAYDFERDRRIINALEAFDRVLRSAFPGKSGLFRVSNRKEIQNLLELLSKSFSKCELWWTRGSSNLEISQMRIIKDDLWLINNFEYIIQEIWVNKDVSSYRQYLLCKSSLMPSFRSQKKRIRWEEAAWFRGRYITRGEYDDGFAKVDGEIVELDGSEELRIREDGRFFFLGSFWNAITFYRNDEIIDRVYNSLKAKGKCTTDLLEPLENIIAREEVYNLL